MATVLVRKKGFDEAIVNLKRLPKSVTRSVARRMDIWYERDFKEEALRTIYTGEGVAANVGMYKVKKAFRYGITHGLGYLTGMLFRGVKMTKAIIKESPGREVRMDIPFNNPFYLPYVVGGTKWNNYVGRDFLRIARNKSFPRLVSRLQEMFKNIDLTKKLGVTGIIR